MTTILIVDDIEDNLQLLGFELEDEGYKTIKANSGKQCLQLIESQKPDLVLLDLRMPVMDGIETLKRIRAHKENDELPVIMVSANDDTDDIIKALDCGAQDYVSKPFVYPILSARIRSALRLSESQRRFAEANKKLAELASQDPLTRAYNRRHFFELANAEFSRNRRSKRPMCLLMIDIDLFKRINDNYGHAAGDDVLLGITAICQQHKRESDIFARLGGEEFVFCFGDTDIQGAATFAERLRKTVEDYKFVTHDGQALQITISLGLTSALPRDKHLEDTLQRADAFLYLAKESGRNKLISDLNQDSIKKASTT